MTKRSQNTKTYHLGISSDVIAALAGRAIAEWSQLEQVVEEVIWSFLELHIDEGRIITSRLDATYKLNMLIGFGKKYLESNSSDALDQIAKSIRTLYQFRNYVAHGVWVTLQDSDTHCVRVLREKVPGNQPAQVVLINMRENYLIEMINQMSDIRESLIELRSGIHTSRGTPFPPQPKV